MNPDRAAQLNKYWRQNNPDARKVLEHKRRVLKLSSIPYGYRSLTKEEWQDQVVLFDGKCGYCLRPASTMEHILPISKGGSHTIDNVIPCCAECNSKKKDRSMLLWATTKAA